MKRKNGSGKGTRAQSGEATPAGESYLWVGELSAQKRAAIRELHRLSPRRNLAAFGFLGIGIFGVVIVQKIMALPVRAAGYFAIGAAIHGLAILMHEAAHGNVFRKPGRDRLFGFLCGIPALLSVTAYRVVHLRHHRYLRTSLDPEEFTNLTRHRWVQATAFYVWILIGGLTYIILIPIVGLMRGSGRERKQILSEYFLIGSLYLILFFVAAREGFAASLLHCLVLPWFVVMAFTNVRGWAEHAMTVAGHPLTQTRVVTSNRLVSFLMCNTNYHLEHHLFPGMPWYNLRRLHLLLIEDYRKAGSFIYDSYLVFLGDALRIGVHGHVPRVPT